MRSELHAGFMLILQIGASRGRLGPSGGTWSAIRGFQEAVELLAYELRTDNVEIARRSQLRHLFRPWMTLSRPYSARR
jgi:hypothetical protein